MALSLTIREFQSGIDEEAFLEAVDEDRQHLSRHGNRIAVKYTDVADVTADWQNARAAGQRIMGIWLNDLLVGELAVLPNTNPVRSCEIGFWIRKSQVGRGYASQAIRTITVGLTKEFARVFAEVHPDNAASIHVLNKCGFQQVGTATRNWGPALVFDLHRKDLLSS